MSTDKDNTAARLRCAIIAVAIAISGCSATLRQGAAPRTADIRGAIDASESRNS